MGRPKNSIPKLCTDASGRAFTKVCGRFISLGRAGTPQAQERYAEILADHARGQLQDRAKPKTAGKPSALTVNELIVQFVTRELPRYSSGEAHAFRAALKVLRQQFGGTLVTEFGPLRFRLLRDAMVSGASGATLPRLADGSVAKDRKPWARPTVNRQAKRVRQLFRWGASWELLPAEIVTRLDTVRSLAIGQTTAHDNPSRSSPSI